MPYSPNLPSLHSSKQQLLDEIESLRVKLADKEAPVNFQDELRQNLSEAIKLGFWENCAPLRRQGSEPIIYHLNLSYEHFNNCFPDRKGLCGKKMIKLLSLLGLMYWSTSGTISVYKCSLLYDL